MHGCGCWGEERRERAYHNSWSEFHTASTHYAVQSVSFYQVNWGFACCGGNRDNEATRCVFWDFFEFKELGCVSRKEVTESVKGNKKISDALLIQSTGRQ